jgi:hypothetical protein
MVAMSISLFDLRLLLGCETIKGPLDWSRAPILVGGGLLVRGARSIDRKQVER